MLSAGVPETRWAYIPHGSYAILDTWYVGGLRGTGSHDVVVDEVFVPQERTYAFSDATQVERPLYRMPMRVTVGAWFAAACLGMAQAALDAVVALASTKVQVDLGPRMRDRPSTQAAVATAAAELDAARLLLHASLADIWRCAQVHEAVTDHQQARAWGAILLATRTAKAVAASMYDAAGTSALYVDCPIERAMRDVQALTQHIVLNSRFWEEAGRVWLGLNPSRPFL
jgi:alkylation response protein AidB-like acyl-CoA dehydrogenase